MGLFSRKNRTSGDGAATAPTTANVENTDESVDGDASRADGAAAGAASAGTSSADGAASGPLDVSDAPERGTKLDVGSLWLPVVDGWELQFSVQRATSTVLAAIYMNGVSALQLQVYAAPRSASLWEEIRIGLMTSIANEGGSSREVEGPFGPELTANIRPTGAQATTPARFIGIDGPRWLLRATLTGRAAVDTQAAEPLLDILRDVVVVRGDSPYPSKSMLPLTIPSDSPSGHAGLDTTLQPLDIPMAYGF